VQALEQLPELVLLLRVLVLLPLLRAVRQLRVELLLL
jgi:hypothetical protein